MILAIYGPTGSGKTTIAKLLAQRLQWQLRCCGEIVRDAARTEAIPIDKFPASAHRGIDSATREAAAKGHPLIIEGRFLRYVLVGANIDDLVLVQLAASPETRTGRLRERLGDAADAPAEDARDSAFALQMYAQVLPLSPNIAIDTNELAAEAVVERILALALPAS